MFIQMSLFGQEHAPSSNVFLGVYAVSVKVGNKIRIRTLEGQNIPSYLYVKCSRTERIKYPIGSIFRLDCLLIKPKNKKPFLQALNFKNFQLSIEFYEHKKALLKI